MKQTDDIDAENNEISETVEQSENNNVPQNEDDKFSKEVCMI